MNTAFIIFVGTTLLFQHHIFCSEQEAATILCLHYENEKNNCRSCGNNYTDITAIEWPSGYFVIQLCSNEFHLTSAINISDKIAVNITGHNSRIVCNSSRQGFLLFSNVTGLWLQDISIHSCGALLTSKVHGLDENVVFTTSIYVVNCTDVAIRNFTVNERLGNGLTMVDNYGKLELKNCNFSASKVEALGTAYYSFPIGSGIVIILSYSQDDSITNAHYIISECNFFRNVAGYMSDNKNSNMMSPPKKTSKLLAECAGKGGGICVVISKNSSSSIVRVSRSSFVENSAHWGGGLYAVISENSRNNSLLVTSCTFCKNSCGFGGGGAADVRYQEHAGNYPQGNEVMFENCLFRENEALSGGGLRFHSSFFINDRDPNKITLRNCNWTSNTADIGAAINMASTAFDLTTKIIVSNCRITSNHLTVDEQNKNSSRIMGRGIFLVKGYHINFEGTVMFKDNGDSAMYLTAAKVEFKSDSNIIFANNMAFEGGAMNMQVFSVLILNDNVMATFFNNTALSAGGAIYEQTSDIGVFLESQHCFIQLLSNDSSERNITLQFENNTARQCQSNSTLGYCGHTVYATTVIPCWSSDEFFNRTFIENQDYDISTSGKETHLLEEREMAKNHTLWTVPGMQVELPIQTLNDLGSEVLTLYHLFIENMDSSNVSADVYYVFNKLVRIFGNPGDKAILVLLSTGTRKIVFRFLVRLQECPPGFRYNDFSKVCECFSFKDKWYSGVSTCGDVFDFTATIDEGYWMGYKLGELQDGDYGKEQFLQHSFCPLDHCSNGTNQRLLPNTTNQTSLDEAICAENRTHTLCSLCREGYTVYYHDYKYSCKKVSNACKAGWLFFILSEIIPVTVFFALVTLLNIKFTDGAISGFLLYAQLSDIIRIKGNGFMDFPKYAKALIDIYQTITRIINLNFFSIDGLSFCLWKEANTLDIIAFKYITIFYSLVLVLAIIAAFRYYHSTRIIKFLSKFVHTRSDGSKESIVIHGLSGFLVICYAECARISLFLLTPSYLYTYKDSKYHISKTVAFYNGNLDYFRGKHLVYALPALIIIFTLGILPPLVLISYPLCYKVLVVLKLGESRVSRLLCMIIPLEKFKPFFDSFQSSFKEDYRFFSGLYFLYRFAAWAALAFSEWSNYHIVLQIELTVFLATHSLCQPYKKRWHNVLDSALLMNLCAVNALSQYNYTTLIISRSDIDKVSLAILIQILLLYSALIYMVAYTIKVIATATTVRSKANSLWLKLKMKLKKENVPEPDDYCELNFSLNAAENRLKN